MQLETRYTQGLCFSSEPYDATGYDRGQTRAPAETDARRRRQGASDANFAMMASMNAANAAAAAASANAAQMGASTPAGVCGGGGC